MKFQKVLLLILVSFLHCSLKENSSETIDWFQTTQITKALPNQNSPFPESKFFVFGKNLFLHFQEFIPYKNPTGYVLLVHGFAGSTYSFRKNIPKLLESNYLVLAVDLPNFGYSMREKNWNHSNEFRAELLWKFIQTYELHNSLSSKTWILVGHSMGAEVVTYMTQISQNKVEKLILVSPALNNKPNSLVIGFTYLLFLEQVVKLWISNTLRDKNKFGKILQSAYGIYPLYPLEEEIEAYRKPLLLENTIEYSFDLIQNSKNKTSLKLHKFQVPVFLFHGLNDTWINFQDVMQKSKEFTNLKMFVYPKVGHCPMETNPEEFNRDLLSILKNETL